MEENTRNINLGVLTNSGLPGYFDDEVAIMNISKELPDKSIYRMEMLTCYGCSSGSIRFDLNGKTYTASKNDIVLCLPNSYIENTVRSKDFDGSMIAISYDTLQSRMNISKNYWNMIMFIAENPVVHLEAEQIGLLRYYGELFKYKHNNPNAYYNKEILRALLRCLFLELASVIAPRLNDKDVKGTLRQGEQLFMRFLELVSAGEGRERSVRAYAEQLCVTPKYLSTLSKSISGKPALSWIHKTAAEAIERQLKYTNKSIKEISDEMSFPNLSFFGKFTKAHLGVSPTEYRKRLGNVE